MTMQISLADSEELLKRTFPVMYQLRFNIDQDEYLKRVKIQRDEGYQIAFLEDHGEVQAVAGFRIAHMLYRGHHLYVDDLVTNENTRSKGYGKAIFDWLVQYAQDEGCEVFSLDSGVQRFDAHRFYFRQRMHISSYNFALNLNEQD